MADIIGQLTFQGREVSALKLDAPGLGITDYIMPDGEDPALANGDRIRMTIEYVVDMVSGKEKHNSEGIGTDALKQIAHVRAIVPECVEIENVLRRADLEAMWAQQVSG